MVTNQCGSRENGLRLLLSIKEEGWEREERGETHRMASAKTPVALMTDLALTSHSWPVIRSFTYWANTTQKNRGHEDALSVRLGRAQIE